MNRSYIKQQTKELLKEQWGILLLASLLEGTFTAAGGLLVLLLGAVLVVGPAKFGAITIYDRVRTGRKTGWRDMAAGFHTCWGDSVLLELLCIAAVLLPVIVFWIITTSVGVAAVGVTVASMKAGLFSGSGTGAGILTGFIFIIDVAAFVLCVIIKYSLAPAMYILYRNPELSALQALKKSIETTKGYRLKLFIFDLSFIGWLILVLVTLGIALIWVGPYYRSSLIEMYRQIYETEVDEIDATDEIEDAEAEAYDSPKEELAKEEQKRNVCVKCGAVLPEGASFCGKCGAKQ